MKNNLYVTIHNCEAVKVSEVPVVSFKEFREIISENICKGKRIASMFGAPSGRHIRLYAVLADDETGFLHILSSDVKDSYPALTAVCAQAHMFEREIAEQWGIVPTGHPCLKPVRFHRSYIKGSDAWNRKDNDVILPADADFYKVNGDEIHEVAVGPVHAGVIEPGHFRFQCNGEKVFNLEIFLGYQRRGIEQAMLKGPDNKSLHFMETLAGDSSIAHGSAYCQILESLSDCDVSDRAQALRGIALELERIANHTGDLGALAGDVAYLPTASFCGRLRGDFLNMTADLCGNRFGRNFVCPGGVRHDINQSETDNLIKKLEKAYKDTANAINLLWATPSVLGRFEETGKIDVQTCNSLGIVGVAARACGINKDIRSDFPFGTYKKSKISVAACTTGDVYARAMIRWLEIQESRKFITERLSSLLSGNISVECAKPYPEMLVVSMVEGWRGEVCHVAITDKNGSFSSYKVVDSSFHNWTALAMALRNEEISNFPLCNKSFNLSYCGHDL